MGLFLDAAKAWSDLHNISYILDMARSGKLTRIDLSFLDDDFPHLAGMQYARDVDFGIRKAEYYGDRLIPALLDKRLDDSKIEKSRNWDKISGRLTAIVNLQNTLDNEFSIVSFNKSKVRAFSQIEAKFAIKSIISENIYFVFLDERSGRYYCKSAFRKEFTDYMENQSPMSLLQKIKILNNIPQTLFIKPGYVPEEI
ncbi:MAG: hypothetical protein J6N52_03550 [Clostridia bacterium]|nr:hypothetical protein [Clostridia bacterium]